jgi:hypothetical protein
MRRPEEEQVTTSLAWLDRHHFVFESRYVELGGPSRRLEPTDRIASLPALILWGMKDPTFTSSDLKRHPGAARVSSAAAVTIAQSQVRDRGSG